MQAVRQALCAPRLSAALNLVALSPALTTSLSTLAISLGDLERDEEHDKRYVDRLKITARGGKGGNGCVSFYQGASRGRRATADGGSGGDGGNVVVRAVANMKSLAGVRQLYKAPPGLHGTKQRQHGRAGRDAVVLVPVGTVVQRLRQPGDAPAPASAATEEQQQGGEEEEDVPEWLRRWRQSFSGAEYSSGSDGGSSDSDSDADEERGDASYAGAGGGAARAAQQAQQDPQQQYQLLADLVEDGQEVVAARGGRGGRGNAGLKATPSRPAPAEPGQQGLPGEEVRLLLELKLLADVGLVGLPSAGKSTLLRGLTAATPRVGDYAFTTLSPQLGVWTAPDPAEEPIVVADIPGLIEGAHQNRGLGHSFLRHIERTKVIAYVLDCQSGNGRRPGPKCWDQLDTLQRELAAYAPHLSRLPALVLANKLDAVRSPMKTLEALRRRTELQVVGLSATKRSTLEPKGTAMATGVPYGPQSHLADMIAEVGGWVDWSGSLTPLAFRLAQLLHEAGARRRAPVWAEYCGGGRAAAAAAAAAAGGGGGGGGGKRGGARLAVLAQAPQRGG